MYSVALRTALLCLACSTAGPPADAAITYLGSGTIPGNATDDTGLTAPLEDGTPGNRAGGMGSAIAWSGVGGHYFMVPDRGPGDGSTTWLDRFYHVMVAVTPSGPGWTVTPSFAHAVLLRNEGSANFVGLSSAFDTTNSPASLRLDPEGMRVGPSGTTIFVSDEFGPFVYEFDVDTGTRLRSIDVAPKFLIANPNANNNAELPPGNSSGRQANRSMEGLAISPGGSKLYGLVQSPLLQDGALDGSNNRVGTNCRLIEMELATSTRREFLYQLSTAAIGATEVLAINDHEFLVLERDGRGLNSGNTAQFKKVFKIDITGATDITGVASLPITGTPLGVTPVTKTLFLDVLVATGIPGNQFPEKLEGIAFGPDLADGRRLLIISADNDFKTSIANWFFAFAVDPADLPGFVPQSIVPIVDATVPVRAGDLVLGAPRPDPARGMTRFDYTLPRDGRVRLVVHDLAGRRVRRLLDGFEAAGARAVTWDCRDDAGRAVASGAYFARLEAHGVARMRKVIVVD